MKFNEFRHSFGCELYKTLMKKHRSTINLKYFLFYFFFSFVFLSTLIFINTNFSAFSFYLSSFIGAIIYLFLSFKIGLSYAKETFEEGKKHDIDEETLNKLKIHYSEDFILTIQNKGFNFNYNLLLILEKEFKNYKNLKKEVTSDEKTS